MTFPREFRILTCTFIFVQLAIYFLWRQVDVVLWNQAHSVPVPHSVPRTPCREYYWQSGFIDVVCPAGVILGGDRIGVPIAYKTETMNYDEVLEGTK
jgi:hypothetical protein